MTYDIDAEHVQLLKKGRANVKNLFGPTQDFLLILKEAIEKGVDISNIFEHRDLEDLAQDILKASSLIENRTKK